MRSKRDGEVIVEIYKRHEFLTELPECGDAKRTMKKDDVLKLATRNRDMFKRTKQEPVIKDSRDRCPIKIDVVEYVPSKQSTVIENLDACDVDLKRFCKTVQVNLGCGSTISAPPTDSNPGEPVRDLLMNEFGVSREFIYLVIHAEYELVPKEISKEELLTDKKSQYELKNVLFISGIPEDNDENLAEMVPGLAKDLNINIDMAVISSCERVGQHWPDRSRGIFVEFASVSARKELFMKSRELRTMENWNGVYINEALTPYRCEMFYLARQYARKRLVKSASTRNGNIIRHR